MTDRELLELAAKAAGIKLFPAEVKNITKRGDDQFIGYMTKPEQWQKGWFNPIRDDDDALRLAVKLELDTLNTDYYVRVFHRHHRWEFEIPVKDDRETATRRAIVLAAAEIGKEQA